MDWKTFKQEVLSICDIEETKRITGCDAVVVVMSGNFIQRGGPALFDKWTRTEMALKNGIDLVIELPTLYAISSAENFADGAVKILDSLGIVDDLYFGAENANIQVLDDYILNDSGLEVLNRTLTTSEIDELTKYLNKYNPEITPKPDGFRGD